MTIEEIIGTIEDGRTQVCATAEAMYDHAKEEVSVALDAFTRRASVSDEDVPLPQPWLPKAERVKEHLAHGEMDEFVRDVFHSWVRKVRDAIPPNLPLRV